MKLNKEARKKTKTKIRKEMDPRLWHKVAAVSGVAALGLGTYGAHGYKPKNTSYKEVWHTANLYHLVHTAALLAAPITSHPNIFGGLLTAGIMAFSGTEIPRRDAIRNKILARMEIAFLMLWVDFMWEYLVLVIVSMTVTILVFRCYAVAYLEDRTYSRLAPLGGFAFIGAWASLMF